MKVQVNEFYSVLHFQNVPQICWIWRQYLVFITKRDLRHKQIKHKYSSAQG